MNSKDDDASILPSDSDTMRSLDETHCRRSCPESVNETRFRSRVPFESSRIPDLDEAILRSGDEERVVWRDEDSEDRSDVLGELADENGIGGS